MYHCSFLNTVNIGSTAWYGLQEMKIIIIVYYPKNVDILGAYFEKVKIDESSLR